MSRKRFTEEFKIEAVRQITERGFADRDIAERLGVSPNRLYAWIKQFGIPAEKRVQFRIRAQRSGACKLSSNESLRSEIY